jgi:hypothetical protein
MRMASTSVWRSVLAALAAAALLGCREDIAAPGQCPSLCPSADVELVDTTLTGVVASDTSVRGFVVPHEAAILVASTLDSLKSLVLVRFTALDTVFRVSGDTVPVRIGSYDSVTIELTMRQRDTAAKDLRVLLVRLPVGTDTTATYATALPFFADSLIVDSLIVDSLVGDSVAAGTLHQQLPVARVLPGAGDSGKVALGIAIRAASPTAVSFGALDLSGAPPRITYWVRGAAPNDTLAQPIARSPAFDTFVMTPVPGVPPAGVLQVGNLPSARTLLRVDIPRRLLDSTSVVRGTLVLTLTRPATGRPGEVFDVEARPVIRDFGGKSITASDTVVTGLGQVTVGQTGPVEIEIGRILRFWRNPAADSLPRAILLSSRLERATLGEVTFAGRTAGVAAPLLQLTFVRPYAFGVP